MFCPSCGAESTIELNYCNRCGANLSSALSSDIEVAPINVTAPTLIIAATILVLTLGAFVGIITGTMALIRAGGAELSAAIPVLGIPSILTIDILLLRQLSKLISAALSPNRLAARKPSAQSQPELRFPRPTTARLEAAPSVTENTTRFFDPVHRDPREVVVRKDPEK